ncbi:helix-turn-helix domain-containing protein [Janibacter terrae]|uniref:helix-turn-helix domain-containing protein n=1 Tax=Janibacter terrae TaxID=103817 RepID=UPI0031F7B6A6
MILTTEEAARRVGVEPRLILSWRERGLLEPVMPGSKPLRFREADVIEAKHRVTSKRRHAELDRLAARLEICEDSP